MLRSSRAPETTDPKTHDAFVLRVLRARRENDLILGGAADRIWAAVSCATLEEYVTERLGMTPSVVPPADLARSPDVGTSAAIGPPS